MYLSHFVAGDRRRWLYMRHREWFRRFAILFLAVSVAGYVTYVLYPPSRPGSRATG